MYEETKVRGARPIHDRLLSFLLAMTMVLSCIVVGIPSFSLKALAASNASDEGTIEFDDADIKYNSNLKDNGDGTYSFTLDLESVAHQKNQNENRKLPTDGYIKVPATGYYLIQLWGGDGASGSKSKLFNYSGGTGGKGGYVYGAIYLEKGDILLYKLGGQGVKTESKEGGAANGGAEHGDMGTCYIGGSGGYSAVYLFKASETEYFVNKYLDVAGNVISPKKDAFESDRTTRYIMIAAGGGGGGAGPDYAIGFKPTGTPDGGAGGNAITTTGVAFDNGYVFAGENGKSSGKKLNYTGKGGTTQPGEAPETWFTLIDSDMPNNWAGEPNASADGGSGSSGNLRGGAGGAGYCGGSGGIMASLVNAYNVGGGGGGSSYISNTLDYQSNLVSAAKTTEGQVNPVDADSNGLKGGYVKITLLDSSEATDDIEETDLTWLNTSTITAKVSKYFTIEDIAVTGAENSTAAYGVSVNEDAKTTNNITVSNLNLASDGELSLTLTVKPKTGFAGGNDVNIFETNNFNFNVTEGYGESKTFAISDKTSLVNVPLDFEAIGNVYSYGVNDEIALLASKLYTDNYADVRTNLSSNSNYDFIESIGEYVIVDTSKSGDAAIVENGSTLGEDNIGLYNVYFDVELKYPEPTAVVGSLGNTRFEANASISQESTLELNGVTYNVKKELTYDDETDSYKYVLKLVTTDIQELAPKGDAYTRSYYKNSTDSGNFVAPTDGYYLVQIWGGNGGTAQNAVFEGGYMGIYHKSSDSGKLNRTTQGGAGGTGGYISTVVRLNADDSLIISYGANGESTNSLVKTTKTSDQPSVLQSSPGNGGKATSVEISDGETTTFLASAGGAGGGAGCAIRFTVTIANATTHFTDVFGQAGHSVDNAVGNIINSSSKPANNDGSDGGQATVGSDDSRGDASNIVYSTNGGAAGSNYLNSSLSQAYDKDYSSKVASRPTNDSGAVVVTRLEKIATVEEAIPEAKKVVLNYALNDNFSLLSANADNKPVVTSEGNKITLTWTLTFEKDSDFLGGNDVPVFNPIATTVSTEGVDPVSVPTKNSADYANVKFADLTVKGDKTVEAYYGTSKTISGDNIVDALFDDEDVATETSYAKITVTPPTIASVTEDGTYDFTSRIEKVSDSSKAVVASPVSFAEKTVTSTVKVYYSINNNLTNIAYEGPEKVHVGDEGLVCTLKPNDGYVYKTDSEGNLDLVVKLGGNTLTTSDYSFDSTTGTLTIMSDVLNGENKGNISISMSAEKQKYNIHFVWTDKDGKSAGTKDFYYEFGASVAEAKAFASTKASEMPSVTGYNFEWDWDTSLQDSETMPGKNCWVIGSYNLERYNLTINYYENDSTNKVADSYTQVICVGYDDTVISPSIDGYKLVDITDSSIVINDDVISTADGDKNIVINVYYETTPLVPVYHNRMSADGSTILAQDINYVDEGAESTVEPKTYDGYNPGVKSADNKVITYSPRSYTVTLHLGDNTTEKTIYYNDYYDFSGAIIPTKAIANWYYNETINDKTEKIYVTEDSVFKQTSDQDVYAELKYPTVLFDGNGATKVAGAELSIVLDQDPITGTLPDINDLFENEGYALKVWERLSPSGKVIATYANKAELASIETVKGEEVTLVAQWMPDTIITATYDTNKSYVSGDWVNTDVIINVSNGLGLTLDDVHYAYSTNGTTWTDLKDSNDAYIDTLTVSTEGSITYTFKTVMNDAASEQEFDTESIVVNIDKTGPKGTISIGETFADKFQDFLETITFGIFKNTDLTVEITATDDREVDAIYYLIKSDGSSFASEEDAAKATWFEYISAEKPTIAAVDEAKAVIYAKLVDTLGNVSYISSNGVVFDTTDPVVVVDGYNAVNEDTKVPSGKDAFADRLLTVTDKNLTKVVVVKSQEGKEDDITTKEGISGTTYELQLANDGSTYTISSFDKAGNKIENYVVTLNPVTDFIAEIEDVLSEIPTEPVADREDALEEAVKEIDKFVETETDKDNGDNIDSEEKAALQAEKGKLLDELKKDYIADVKIVAVVDPNANVVTLPTSTDSIKAVLIGQATKDDAEAIVNGATKVEYALVTTSTNASTENATAISNAEQDEVKSIKVAVTRTVYDKNGTAGTPTELTSLATVKDVAINFDISLGNYAKTDRVFNTYLAGISVNNTKATAETTAVSITSATIGVYSLAYTPDTNITGTVTDENGKILPGVTVELLDKDGKSFSPKVTTTTDENGEYSFGLLPDGTYNVQVVIDKDKAGTTNDVTATNTVTISEAGVASFGDITVDGYNSSGSLIVTVKDSAGNIIKKADVTLEEGKTISVTDGVAVFERVKDADYTVKATANGKTGETSITRTDDEPAEIEVVIEGYSATATISGVVTDESGNPIEGAEVSLWDTSTDPATQIKTTVTTGADGKYEFTDIPEGDTYKIEIVYPNGDGKTDISPITVFDGTATDTKEPVVNIIATTADGETYTSGTPTNQAVTIKLVNETQNIGTDKFQMYDETTNTWVDVDGDTITITPESGKDTVTTVKVRAVSESGEESVAKTITVESDALPATGEISIGETFADKFQSFISTITFGIFKNENLTVAISADDDNGIDKIYYIIKTGGDSFADADAAKASTDWVEYNNSSKPTITATDKAKAVVYAKIVDGAGNVTNLSTDGVIFDTTDPEITVSGKEKNTTAMDTEATAYGDRLVTFSDENLDTVTVKIGDDEPVALTADEIENGYSLDNATKQTYVFVVTDKAGNSVERIVSVDTVADFIEELDDTWVDTQEPPQPRDPSAEEIKKAIQKIDDLLDKETSDEDSNLTDEEIAALNAKKAALNAVLEQGEEFIKKYLVKDSSTYPDYKNTVYNEATDDNFNQIISGKDDYEDLPQAAKEVVNEAIKNSEFSTTSEIGNYPDLLDAAADKALEEAKETAEKADVDVSDILDPVPTTTEEKLEAVEKIEQAIAEKFVQDYASNGNEEKPYNTTDNKVTTDNSEKVASGADTYNGYNDSIQDKIDNLIAQPNDEGVTKDGNYDSYPAMLKYASGALLDKELNEAIGILEEMREDTDADLPDEKLTDNLEQDIQDIVDAVKELIAEIDPTDPDAAKDIDYVLDAAKDEIDTIIAREFVENYASNNDSTNPYEDKDPGTNLIDTPTEADRVTAGNDPYKHVNDNVKDKINELIAQPDGSGDPEDGNYASYPDMLKDAAKQDLEDAINEAKELINDMYENGDLTEEERDAHLQEIDDIADAAPTPTTADQMIERKDAIEEKAAEIFVDEYASEPDHTTPYTEPEGDNPIPDGNNNQVVNGKEPFENTSKGIQDKIDDLIAQPGTDGEPEDGNYSSYKDMLDDAIVPSLSETVSDVEKLIDEMVKQGDLTQDEADTLKQKIETLAEGALEEPIDLEDVLDAKETIEDIGAETFIKEYASNNDPDKPYNKDDNKIDTQDKADKVTDGSDIFDGNKPEGTYDPLPDYLKDKINDKISDPDGDGTKDSTKDYASYPEMLADAAKKALDEAKETAEEILDKMVENGDITEEEKGEVLEEIQEIIDSLPDPASTEEIIDAKNAINDTLADEFVKTYASDDDGVYDKDGNKIDGTDDAEKVISGSDVYDDLPESVKDMVNDKISDPDGDGTKDSTKDYESYPEMLDAALKEKADEAKQQVKDLNNDPDAKNDDTQEAIEEIDEILNDPTMTPEQKKEAIDDIVADEFIESYASDNDPSDPYDKTSGNGVTEENADKILSGLDPYDSLTDDQKDLVDKKISESDSDPDKAFDDYAEMVEAAKQAVEDAKDKAIEDLKEVAEEAKKELEEIYDPDEVPAELIEQIEEALEEAIDKLENDSVDTIEEINAIKSDAQDEFDDAVAQGFVNEYASGSDNDPYDKTDDKLDVDSIKQVVSGKDAFDKLPDSVKSKIDEIISTPTGSETTYPSYSDMLKDAQTIANNISDDNDIRVDVKVDGLMLFDNVNATSVSDIKSILIQSIDEDDIDVMLAGGRVSIVMTVKEISDDDINNSAINADGLKLYKHIEITIVKTQYDKNDNVIGSENITKTAEPISFVVSVADIQKDGRVFYVYADHTGKTKAEKTADGDGVLLTSTVEFVTSDFSVFSIAYVDDSEIEEIVNTLDESPIITMFTTFGLSALMFLATKKKKEEIEGEMN